MRTFIAVLLGATACLPALVQAKPVFPDPADGTVSVPAVSATSDWAAYRPYREPHAPAWQALNQAVASASCEDAMSHGSMQHASEADAAEAEHTSHHEEAAP